MSSGKAFGRILLIVIGLVGIFITSAQAFEQQSIYGEWTPPDMDAVISIRPCGAKLCADLVSHTYSDVTEKDINNPNPKLKQRPLIGVKILEGLYRDGRKIWRGGSLYDPRTGNTYHSKIKILDHERLKIIGCIGPRLCKGYVWKRIAPADNATLRAMTARTNPSTVSGNS